MAASCARVGAGSPQGTLKSRSLAQDGDALTDWVRVKLLNGQSDLARRAAYHAARHEMVLNLAPAEQH